MKREMRPYRASIVALSVLIVASTLLSLAFSYLIRYVINGATAGNLRVMWFFAAVCAALALLKVSLQAARSYCTEKCRAKIVAGLRGRLFYRLLRADYAEAERYHSGDLLNRFTSDVAEVANAGVSIFPAVAGMATQCAGSIVALFLLDPLFTAIFTAGGILLAVCSAFFRKATKKYHKELTEADGKSRSFIQESLASLMTVKAYGAEERTAERSDALLGDYYDARMKKNRLNVAIGGSFSLLSAFSTVFAVVWCCVEISAKGSADYGSILSVIMLLSQLQQPFASFSAVFSALYSRAAAAERLSETEEIPVELSAKREKKEREEEYASSSALVFDGVRFCYRGREETLRGGFARVPLRKITCITGTSGSGKSTLFKLILGMYPLSDGKIYLEKDVRSLQTAERGNGETHASDAERVQRLQKTGEFTEKIPLTATHRDLFAYVPQGNFLFSGTVYENLTFFSGKNTSDADVRRALQAACATFVYDLPKGLQTSLRERGGGLSEGQLQRLAVARALLSDRPVLLLDEATSALDEQTEKELLSNVRALSDKTCLIVTHRPAALSVADSVLRLGKGRLFSEKDALSDRD